MTGTERRTTQRFSMRLPLTVRWTTGAAVGETSTESRDVSSRGVYFFLSKDVKEGSPVEILLTLPNEITLAGPVRVRCLGRVQRTEQREEGAVGVVAAIERYEFSAGQNSRDSHGLQCKEFLISFLLAHCGGGQDQPGCLGPSAKRPGSVSCDLKRNAVLSERSEFESIPDSTLCGNDLT